jgi:two-component system, OmpR family, phosphate regulon sensor histidine kinase PhoR
MRFRLLALPVAVTGLGVLLLVGIEGGSWALALAAGAAAGALVAASGAVTYGPLEARIRALARTIRVAAERHRSPSPPVSPHDELDNAARTFDELSAQWSTRAEELVTECTTLAAVLDGMAEGIWVTDEMGTIVRHNFALRKMLYEGQTLNGQRPLSLIRSTDLNDAVMAACRRGESSRLEVTVSGVRPRVLEVQVMPLRRELRGSAAVFHDLTELRRLEKIRKDFVANVSHELRTPITTIRGYAETLRTGALADPEHAPKMVEIIHRQSERLSVMVADLLELSRLESGELELERGPVSLAEAAARAAEAVRGRAQEKRQSLSVDVDAELTARGDARAVEQVVLNLLDNAVKYTPQGGEVEVTSGRENGRCFLTVRDTGIGIEEKHLSRIFERFYRVDRGRSRETGGTGLGLSIVKHLVGAMGGEVRVESGPGRGSRFTVVLPVLSSTATGEPSQGESTGGNMATNA